jgi:hypothetical protein
MEEENYLETEENKEALKEIRGQILKHNEDCKICGRKEKCYKSLCFWDFIERTREIAQELSSEIANNGRSSLIDIERIKRVNDKFLEII